MRTGYSKSEKMDPWVSKSEGKGTKSEPRGDQNASKNQPSEKVAKREPKGPARQDEMGGFWEPFSIKNR